MKWTNQVRWRHVHYHPSSQQAEFNNTDAWAPANNLKTNPTKHVEIIRHDPLKATKFCVDLNPDLGPGSLFEFP